MLADLDSGALARILRPTVLSALVAGVLAAAIAWLLSSPLAAVGILIGLGLAVLNVRMLAASVAKVQTEASTSSPEATAPSSGDERTDADEAAAADERTQGKVIRRLLRTNSAVRLAVITLVAIVLVLVQPPLGIGVVIGLVIFQIAFVLNAGRAILSTGVV